MYGISREAKRLTKVSRIYKKVLHITKLSLDFTWSKTESEFGSDTSDVIEKKKAKRILDHPDDMLKVTPLMRCQKHFV